jgi:predicted phage terminase large subunit-like protein
MDENRHKVSRTKGPIDPDSREALRKISDDELKKKIETQWDLYTKEQKEKANEWLAEYNIKKCRDNFYAFHRFISPLIIPDEIKAGRHLKLFCQELQKLEKNTSKKAKDKLQLFLPPGSMKTLTLCLFVAWVLGRHPNWYIIHVGHSVKFAEENYGQRIRDLIKTPEYNNIFPETIIRHDSKSRGSWKLTSGGTYLAAGAGSAIAGRRAHISICDDVVSEQTADSKIERGNINSWYVPGLRTRLLPGGSEVIVNTRWHLDDLSGFITKQDEDGGSIPWRIIKVPAIIDEESSKILGLPVNSSFWPELWPLSDLLDKKATAPPSKWQALYMQNPVPEEGNLFKQDMFKIWEHNKPPTCSYILCSFDTAFSKNEEADFSAYQVWGVFQNVVSDFQGSEHRPAQAILLEAGRGRWDFRELCEKCTEINNSYEPDSFLVEKKASGQSLIPELRLRGIPVMEYTPDKDKVSRAHACLPFFYSGYVWIPNQKWAQELVLEAMQFPKGTYDDQVDAMTQAILWLRDTFNVSHHDYQYGDEDEPEFRGRQTYWTQVEAH